MKNFIYTFILFFGITTNAQTDNLNPYDEKLAKELGADEYGMKQYVFCILKTGSNTTATPDEKKKYFEGHMANINKLAEEGKLVVAGPFMKNDRNYRGIFIFNCSTIEEAQKLVETDPAVKAKLFEVELTPWYSSAALMQVGKNHDKVAKTKF
jgi:uncharacterized protein